MSASWKAEADEEDGPSELTKGEKGLMSKAFGVSGLAVGVLSVWWAVAADPAVGGDLAQRGAFLGELMTSDRQGVKGGRLMPFFHSHTPSPAHVPSCRRRLSLRHCFQ